MIYFLNMKHKFNITIVTSLTTKPPTTKQTNELHVCQNYVLYIQIVQIVVVQCLLGSLVEDPILENLF